MTRYVIRPRADDDFYYDRPERVEVLVSDDRPQPTGIYDQFGNELFRVQDRVPMGFQARKER